MSARIHVWRVPLALALLSLCGLVSALVGDGWWDGFSWVALGVPVAICLRNAIRPRAATVRDARHD